MQDNSNSNIEFHNLSIMTAEYPYEKMVNRDTKPLSFDHVLDQIGFGKYQLVVIFIVGLIAFAEGAQLIVFTLSTTLLQTIWNFGNDIENYLAAAVFCAILLGSGASGLIADKFGRRNSILISMVIMLFFNTMCAFSIDLWSYGIFRFSLSFVLGFFAPLGFTMAIEVVPTTYRGGMVVAALGFFFMGEIFGCLLGYVTLESLTAGDWRIFTLLSGIPALLALLLGLFYLDESSRYLLAMGRYSQSFAILDQMNRVNGFKHVLKISNEDKTSLIVWQREVSIHYTNRDNASIRSLFKGNLFLSTLIIWIGWFLNSFIYYGIVIVLPEILKATNSDSNTTNDISNITISIIIESTSLIFASVVLAKNPFSRKRSIIFFYALCGMCSLMAFFHTSTYEFILWVTLIKIFIDVTSFFFYLTVCEIYPTNNRATGIGMANCIGKTGSIIMPLMCTALMNIQLYLPLLGFFVASLIGGLFTLKLPFDTNDKDLN